MNPVASTLAVLLLVSAMFAMGTATTTAALADVLRRPAPLMLGVLVNLVAIPAAALVLLDRLDLDLTSALALMVVAAAPGGGTGALLALHVRGDRAQAVALQVVLAVTSLVAAPLWLHWYAGADGAGQIDLVPLVAALLVCQWLPLGIGLALGVRRPAAAAAVHPGARKVADLLLAALIVVLVVTSGSELDQIDRATFLGIGAVGALTLLGGLAGAIGAPAVRRATAMTTLIRNLSLALAATAFMDDADAAALVVLTYGLGMYLVAVAWVVMDRSRAARTH